MKATFEVDKVSVSHRLKEVDLTIPSGRCIHILGPNGAGKSTLLNTLGAIVPPTAGQVLLNQRPIEAWPLPVLASFRSILAQHSEAVFSVSVADYLSFFSHDEQSIVPTMLEKALEVGGYFSQSINRLSGGERQRVEICRSLMQVWPAIEQGEAVLLLDEPLQGLDIRHQYGFLALCTRLCELGNTLILSCHDISLSANYGQDIIFMKHGQVTSYGAVGEVMTAQNLENTFDCHFAVKERDDFLEIQVCAPIVG